MLDTNALIWWIRPDGPLDDEVRAAIEDAFNEVVVSAASIWELRVKEAKGECGAPDDLLVMLDVQEVDILDVNGVHAENAARLPMHHRDPFDRLIIAQAIYEEYTVVTSDRRFGAYGVEVLAAR